MTSLFSRDALPDGLAAPAPQSYHVARWIEIRFSDTDMQGHVNNTAYVAYFEALRFYYLARFEFPDVLTVASVKVDFRVPARFGDLLRGAIRVVRLGTRSLDMQHLLHRRVDDALVAEGVTTLVAIDADTGRSVPLSAVLRRAVADLDGVAV